MIRTGGIANLQPAAEGAWFNSFDMLISSFTSVFGPMDDVCRGLIQRVCPLFVLTGRRQPRLIGSGMPIQIGPVSAVLTAAHVLAPYSKASVLTLGSHRSLVLTGERRGYGYKRGQHLDVDLALVLLADEERDQLRAKYTFTYSLEFGVPRRPEQLAFYAVVGYPQSKNKLSPRLKRSGATVAAYFITRQRVPLSKIACEGKHESVHFAVGADAKNSIGLHGEPVGFASPIGMSGGGIWLLEYSSRAATPPTPRLVGVNVEYWRQPGAVVCTRIENVETMVRDLLRP